ncbi:unnamed protein product [Prorocentrum cordatum]|uniref:Uncharacterized protein n=1 Tax=Prorocentrum cordatum TaxID=2364126 RepID=A0ABN9QBW5_9DINO|nr:unnamed protein product [Polarella glacialis]
MWSSSFPVEASDVCLVGSGPYARCPRARALAPPQVRLVENGSQLAARSYAAASLGTEAWAQVGEPRFHSTGLFAATALLLSGFALSRGACSRAGRLCGLAGATGGSDGGDVELGGAGGQRRNNHPDPHNSKGERVPVPLPPPRFRLFGPPGRPSSPPLDSPRSPGQHAPRERSGEHVAVASVPSDLPRDRRLLHGPGR